MMDTVATWTPPGRNCGLCGMVNCEGFREALLQHRKEYADCPFYPQNKAGIANKAGQSACYGEEDVLGNPYDFVLTPLPGEISARKIVLPFRSDLVEKMAIHSGDIVLGRPMGAGCPVPHVLKVIEADWQTGVLTTWVVGPQFSRDQPVKDLNAYHMIGFEGLASHIRKQPEFGRRMTFLPGFCMMNLNHTGLVNMVLQQREGLHLRIEDIRILAG